MILFTRSNSEIDVSVQINSSSGVRVHQKVKRKHQVHNDRFSRTGANAIFLAERLRNKGIQIIAASAPLDTMTPVGAFQQNLQLLFSHFDNQLRRDRTIRGMKQKFEKGYIIGKVPMGYDQKSVNGEMVITINETGKAIAKAFNWKAEQGLKSSVIASRLHKLGFKIREKQLSRIFKNLFYCGLLSNKMLGDNIVEGRWPALVSKENFLKANDVLTKSKPSQGTLLIKRKIPC